MKKMAKILAALLMMILCVSSASATMVSSTYYLDDLKMSISMPADYMIVTRDTQDGDPVLAQLGMDRASVVAFLESNELYLNAIEQNINYEVTVAMSANTIDNFNSFSATTLDLVADSIPETFAELGMNVTKTDLYENDEAKFIVIYYNVVDEYGDLNHVLQYFTVYNYQAVNIRLFSYVGEITPENEQFLLEIVDSANFGL